VDTDAPQSPLAAFRNEVPVLLLTVQYRKSFRGK
jgi:hypothetical protein